MFDLITGKVQHVPSAPAVPILISTAVQSTLATAAVIASVYVASHPLPEVPTVMAFVAEMPAALPPPPPPPPKMAVTPGKVAATARPVVAGPVAAPILAPAVIEPEPPAQSAALEGVPGGVEGGVAGGVIGGVGTIIEGAVAPPPPPPPPPPVRQEPVRIGGEIQAPALIHRVEPVYPGLAQFAKTVTLLRGHPLLAKAATAAVEQWRYEPLKLNGVATPFRLTVSLWFHFTDRQ
jgi:protein TonB